MFLLKILTPIIFVGAIRGGMIRWSGIQYSMHQIYINYQTLVNKYFKKFVPPSIEPYRPISRFKLLSEFGKKTTI